MPGSYKPLFTETLWILDIGKLLRLQYKALFVCKIQGCHRAFVILAIVDMLTGGACSEFHAYVAWHSFELVPR